MHTCIYLSNTGSREVVSEHPHLARAESLASPQRPRPRGSECAPLSAPSSGQDGDDGQPRHHAAPALWSGDLLQVLLLCRLPCWNGLHGDFWVDDHADHSTPEMKRARAQGAGHRLQGAECRVQNVEAAALSAIQAFRPSSAIRFIID